MGNRDFRVTWCYSRSVPSVSRFPLRCLTGPFVCALQLVSAPHFLRFFPCPYLSVFECPPTCECPLLARSLARILFTNSHPGSCRPPLPFSSHQTLTTRGTTKMEVEQYQQCPWITQARALDLFPLLFAHIFPSRDFAHEPPADSTIGRPLLHPSHNKGT